MLNTGHLHPKVQKAVQDQLARFSHTCFHVTPYEDYVALAERLNALVPSAGPNKTIFLTTGAEAVENAVKIAKAHSGRPGVISFAGAFHGRTAMGLALTGKMVPYKRGFGPFPSEVYHAPFPNALRGISTADSLASVESLFHCDIDAARVAAIIVEPVQGEGGFNVAPADFLRGLRALCDRHGILMIADEVQSGFGRTGRMFAIEHSGVTPDLVTMAKSLAGGFPLSAVSGSARIMDARCRRLGGTYGGSPIACAAALAVLDVIEEEDLLERSRRLGTRLRTKLSELARRYAPRIAEVRGLGAMVAMELRREDGGPDAALAAALVKQGAEQGLILLSCGVDANVIRFLVPLMASESLVDEGLAILSGCMQALVSAAAPDVAAAS